MGFPHVLQLARLDRIRQLSAGRQEAETVWLMTRLGPEQADAARLLELARQYWCIENGTHYRLDVSAGEDRCRVRHPVATTVLGILRRAVQGEYRAWARHQRKARDSTCPAFLDLSGRICAKTHGSSGVSMGRTQMLRKLTGLLWNCKPTGPVGRWGVYLARMRWPVGPRKDWWFCTTTPLWITVT